MFNIKNKQGQSLLEIVVALAIFSLVSTAIASMVLGSFSALSQGGDYLEAEVLAQEAIEAVRSVHDRAWNENIFNKSSVEISGNKWIYSGEGTEEIIGKFVRKINFNNVCRDSNHDISPCPALYSDVHSKEVAVRVEWIADSGVQNYVEKYTYITNWDSRDWTQTDWSGGAGQSIWSDQTRYDVNNGNVLTSSAGNVILDQTLTSSGFYNWPFEISSNYIYDTNKIEISAGQAQLKAYGASSAGSLANTGFEYATSTGYNWTFNNSADYTYDANKIEVVSGAASLKSSGSTIISGSTSNSGFDTNSSGWTYYDWDQAAGDPDATGAWQSAGGNPGGYVNVNLPSNLKNRTLGGYWEQSINIASSSPDSVLCEFDWRALTATLPGVGVNQLYLAVYLESSTGIPVSAPVFQKNFTAPFAWESHSGVNAVNCTSKVSAAGTYYYKIAVWASGKNANTGPITVGFDNAKVYWQKNIGGSYPVDKPIISPNSSFSVLGVDSWSGFTETATKNGGEIYYQLSGDDGATWKYWNGTAWSNVIGSTDYNIATVINTNIVSFSTSTASIKFKAFLSSSGSQAVSLDDVFIGSVPHPVVWNFSAWGVGGGEVTPVGSRIYGGGNPNNFVDINVPAGSNDTIGGYWQQAFTTTASNPTVNINFDYKVFDFSGVPNTAEIRVYLDSATGDPVNQIGSSIPVSALSLWVGAPSISTSTALAVPGTYYFKIAFWVDTPNTGAGPFRIGFDNVILNWSSSGYPQDKPTIRNKVSFAPALVSGWTAFIESATKNTGEIYYQLSDDDGNTWKFWGGASWINDPDGDEGMAENDYTTGAAVNSYINLFSAVNKKIMFKAFLVGDGTQQIQLDNIELAYNISAIGNYYGNRFVVDNTSGAGLMTLTNTDKKTSIRFVAQNSKTVNAVRVYLEQERGTSPVYRYGLQGDVATVPSGVWLGATGKGYGDYQATTIGWQTIPLQESVNLVAGATYHLLVQYQSGTIGQNDCIELLRSSPNNFLNPYDNNPNLNSNVLFSGNGGSIWSIGSYQPIFVLDFSDGTNEGNPYHDLAVNSVWGTNYYGEQFMVSGTNKIISSIEFLVSKNSNTMNDNLYVNLFNISDNILMASSTIAVPANITLNAYEWQTYSLPAPIILQSGKEYRVFVFSPLSLVTRSYLVRSIFNDNTSVYNNINYDGANSFFVSSGNSGAGWVTSNINYDISGFRFAKTLFRGQGYFISSAFNTGKASVFNVVEWDQIVPACLPACEVKLQIQTAPDNAGSPGTWTPTWCGPEGDDGDETDYFTINTGSLIKTDHNGSQWVRYKAILSGDGTDTPTLGEIRINYK